MPFNLQDYEPVEERLARFWEKHPNGRIRTEILSSEADSIVMLALVFRDAEDKLAAATGHAQETPGEGMVNKTSWVENCETSAIGRALANLGYAPKGVRASREEMEKATRPEPPTKPLLTTRSQQQKIAITAGEHGIDDRLRYRITRRLFGVTSSKDVPRAGVDRLLKAFVGFAAAPEESLKYLEKWEAENLPSTAAQAIREPGEEHILTREDLESAGQTNFDAPAIPD